MGAERLPKGTGAGAPTLARLHEKAGSKKERKRSVSRAQAGAPTLAQAQGRAPPKGRRAFFESPPLMEQPSPPEREARQPGRESLRPPRVGGAPLAPLTYSRAPSSPFTPTRSTIPLPFAALSPSLAPPEPISSRTAWHPAAAGLSGGIFGKYGTDATDLRSSAEPTKRGPPWGALARGGFGKFWPKFGHGEGPPWSRGSGRKTPL